MSDEPPTQNGITTTVEEGPGYLTLPDGRVLFARHVKTVETRWRRLVGPDGKTVDWVNFGRFVLGPREEWCRDPDGTERRCSFAAELEDTAKQMPQERGSLWRRFFGLGT